MSDNISIEEVGVEQSTPLSLEEIVSQTNERFNNELQRLVLEHTQGNTLKDEISYDDMPF